MSLQYDSVSFGCINSSGSAGSSDSSVLNFLRNLSTVLCNDGDNLHSCQQYVVVPPPPHHCQCVIFVFLIIAILNEATWCLILVLIFYFHNNDIEFNFIHPLATYLFF